MKRTIFLVVASFLAAFSFTSLAIAQGFPAKPVRIIISYPPGGSTDMLARTIAQGLQENLGQPTIVDNRPGGNFIIAADAAAKGAPDGHTLFMAADSTFTVNPLGAAKLPYDADRDFAPITLVALQSLFVVASGKAPAKNLKDMIAYAKANPGKVSFGSSALVARLIGEQMKIATGTDLQHIPFKGSPPMLQALLTGDVEFAITSFTPYVSYTPDGRLVGLAVTGTRREAIAADTPTLAELNLSEVGSYLWYAMFVPSATPPPIQERLRVELFKVLNDAPTRQKLLAAGIEPATSTPEELALRIRNERAKWARVIKSAGIVLN